MVRNNHKPFIPAPEGVGARTNAINQRVNGVQASNPNSGEGKGGGKGGGGNGRGRGRGKGKDKDDDRDADGTPKDHGGGSGNGGLQLCRRFYSTGQCRWGDACFHLHAVSKADADRAQAARAAMGAAPQGKEAM